MDNYDIISTIGRGGSGKVFLVRSKVDARQYALKQISVRTKTNTKESVLKEAKILSRLKHPHIVTCCHSFFDKDEDNLYILQDYCDGGNLQDKIFEMKEKGERIKEQQIMQWFVQITMAVQHIHSNKILHRDLKTQNVFLTKRDLIKIGDFGIAKVLENTIDMAETCCGTPCYLSPELCQDVPYTSKSDIWALGCLLYEVCSLKPAFSASNLVSLFYKIVSGDIEALPPGYSKEINDLILIMMSKPPDNRPSAGAMLNIPFVKEHLSLFIEGKTVVKEQQRSSPAVIKRAIQEYGPRSSPDSCHSSKLSNDYLPEKNNIQKNITETTVSPVVLDVPNCPDYPDDFEDSSSDEAEYSTVDFDDAVTGDDSLKQPMTAKTALIPAGMTKYESYSDDDFEEDSDESLEDVLACAKAAQYLEVSEETVEDYERPVSSCRDLIKEGCINVLGEKAFKEVQEFCQGGKANIEINPGHEFEKLSGSEQMETCFLVNELFMDGSTS